MSEEGLFIGIIGGSGLYEMDGFENIEEIKVETPFGDPSDVLVKGKLDGVPLVFLPRHGLGHRYSPSYVNYQANIFALKTLGVTQIISVSAVGSLKKEIEPRHLVIPDQVIDRTRGRKKSFFGQGLVAHVGMADPYCPFLRKKFVETLREMGEPVHDGGTYVCMEGPQFSTRAESNLYRSWGCSIIGMTSCPEANLAREAEICYATIALSTDYDVWNEEPVTVEMVMGNMGHNVSVVKAWLRKIIPALAAEKKTDCSCLGSLKDAILTSPDRVPKALKESLSPLLSKYYPV